jgi:uncharacterized membrane protein
MARRGRNPSPVRSGTDGSVPAKSTATDDAEETSSPGGLLPAVVQQQIDRELSQLEPQTRSRVQRLVVQVAHEVAEFFGPLPPPYYLREYEATAPGAPDRIISMAEQEQQHRHAWERSALSNTTVGLWFGFFIALGLVGGGIYSVAVGQPYVAGGFLTAGAIGMVPALIRGRYFVMQRQMQSSRQPAKPVPAKRSI